MSAVNALQILNQDVLDASAEALMLAIDGAARGMEGNVARVFAGRWPERWREIEEEVRYPVPLGRTFEVELENDDDCPFRLVILASTLHHMETLSDGAKLGIVRSAMEEAVRSLARYRLRSLATTAMRGGWRLSLESTFPAMLQG